MEESNPPDQEMSPEDQIRALGFDPRYLTPEEQRELLEIHLLYPDEVLV